MRQILNLIIFISSIIVMILCWMNYYHISLIMGFILGYFIPEIIDNWIDNWYHPLNGFTDWLHKTKNPLVKYKSIEIDTDFGPEDKIINLFETSDGHPLSSNQMYNIYLSE